MISYQVLVSAKISYEYTDMLCYGINDICFIELSGNATQENIS